MIPDQEPASSIGPAQARMHVATLTDDHSGGPVARPFGDRARRVVINAERG
jgi:hypothetical protein